jgi:hypothetical protein
MIKLRSEVNEKLEVCRREKAIGKSLEAQVVLPADVIPSGWVISRGAPEEFLAEFSSFPGWWQILRPVK